MALSDVSVPLNTVQFGEDDKLCAEITCVMSANEIWCTQCSIEESVSYIIIFFHYSVLKITIFLPKI